MNLFLRSVLVIARKDLLAHFGDLTDNLLLFSYFITGAIFWAATLGRLVFLAGYFQFLIVGLMVLGIYNTSFNYMNVVSTEVRRGYVKYILVLPIDRIGLTLGRVATGAAQGIIYVGVLFVFAAFMVGLPTLFGGLTILSTVIALSFCLSSLGISIATHFKEEMMDPVSDILGLLLVFASTLFYPQALMPYPIQLISRVNVLSAGANLIRGGFGLASTGFQDVVVVIAWSVFFGILSIRGYYKQLDALG